MKQRVKVMESGCYGRGLRFIGESYDHYGYSLTEPVNEDGTLTRYAKFLVAIASGIGIKADILKAAGYTGGNPAAVRGHHCSTFTALKQADLIRYDHTLKSYVLGDQFAWWNRKILMPAIKRHSDAV